jgi:hypothetical protein
MRRCEDQLVAAHSLHDVRDFFVGQMLEDLAHQADISGGKGIHHDIDLAKADPIRPRVLVIVRDQFRNDVTADIGDIGKVRKKSVAHLKITAAEINDNWGTSKLSRMPLNQHRHLLDIGIHRAASRTHAREKPGLLILPPETVFVDVPEDLATPLLLVHK